MTFTEVLARHTPSREEYPVCSECADFMSWPCLPVQLARQLAQSADALRTAEERIAAIEGDPRYWGIANPDSTGARE